MASWLSSSATNPRSIPTAIAQLSQTEEPVTISTPWARWLSDRAVRVTATAPMPTAVPAWPAECACGVAAKLACGLGLLGGLELNYCWGSHGGNSIFRCGQALVGASNHLRGPPYEYHLYVSEFKCIPNPHCISEKLAITGADTRRFHTPFRNPSSGRGRKGNVHGGCTSCFAHMSINVRCPRGTDVAGAASEQAIGRDLGP